MEAARWVVSAAAPVSPEDQHRDEVEDELSEAYGGLIAAMLAGIALGAATVLTAGAVTAVAAPGIAAASAGIATLTSEFARREAVGTELDGNFAGEVSNLVQRALNDELRDAVNAVITEHGNDLNDPAVSRALREALSPSSDRWQQHVAAMSRQLATAGMAEGVVARARAEQQRTGQRMGLRWVTRRDSRVRATHAAGRGQIVPVGERFIVGGSPLRFPGDPLGPPKEVMNCRCRIRPVRLE